jgi:hypothetical protein
MGYCIPGEPYVPPLPSAGDREDLPELIATQLYGNFGGVVSRDTLPEAIASLRAMHMATNATQYWSLLIAAIQRLHDNHSSPAVGFFANDTLPICFVQGDADLSHDLAPPDPLYPDVLVSHVLAGSMAGLVPGDRLVAVDGMHPLAFARSLLGKGFNNTQSTDPREYEGQLQRLNDSIHQWATRITVIHCDRATATATQKCAHPQTIPVPRLPATPFGQAPICDNRPAYHLASGNPDPVLHNLNNGVFFGALAGTTADEALYGMMFDSLAPNPGPDPYAGPLADIRSGANGVVIDHRLGLGGGYQYASETSAPFLPTTALTVTWGPEPYYANRHWTNADGALEFADLVNLSPFVVGSSNPKAGLKAAVLVSYDVSASDFLAYGMRGAKNVRSFGTRSAGAFAQIVGLGYAGGGLSYSMGNGDTFSTTGVALSATGAEPDEYVVPTQSDLLAGRDTAYERALAWLRSTTTATTTGGK